MYVKEAKQTIEKITKICKSIQEDLHKEERCIPEYYYDAIAYLGDYKELLGRAIDNAEINI